MVNNNLAQQPSPKASLTSTYQKKNIFLVCVVLKHVLKFFFNYTLFDSIYIPEREKQTRFLSIRSGTFSSNMK